MLDDRQAQIAALSLLLSRIEVVLPRDSQQATQIIPDVFFTTPRKHHVLDTTREAEMKCRRSITDQILNSLSFDAVQQHQNDAPEIRRKAFKWIFKDPGIGSHAERDGRWSNFRTWLETQNGLYWISGKEASGKSTLLKSILAHPRTEKLLGTWAAGSPADSKLCVAKFFFRSGDTAEQRSQAGLYRSILFEILKQEPRLVPVVFPREYATGYCNSVGYSSLLRSSTDTTDSCSSYSSVTQVRTARSNS